MSETIILEGLWKAAWVLTGAVGIVGTFLLILGGMVWTWLQVSKWLMRYIHKVRGEFKEAFTGEKPEGKRVRT